MSACAGAWEEVILCQTSPHVPHKSIRSPHLPACQAVTTLPPTKAPTMAPTMKPTRFPTKAPVMMMTDPCLRKSQKGKGKKCMAMKMM